MVPDFLGNEGVSTEYIVGYLVSDFCLRVHWRHTFDKVIRSSTLQLLVLLVG